MKMSTSMKYRFELRAPVTPYICSSPEDFTEEREWLSKYVFPKLKCLCTKRGTYFAPVDIRWSADDDLCQNGFLLSLLLDLVKQTCPFFLCLVGERYGQHVEQVVSSKQGQTSATKPGSSLDLISWLEKNLSYAAETGHRWVLQGDHAQSSIMELEIMAAVFLGHSVHNTFYYRQSEHLESKLKNAPEDEHAALKARFCAESENAKIKVALLKQNIVKRGMPVRYFKTKEELGTIVLQDWISILDIVCPPIEDSKQFFNTAVYDTWLAQEALLSRLRSDYLESSQTECVIASLTNFAQEIANDRSDGTVYDNLKQADQEVATSVVTVFRQKSTSLKSQTSICLLSSDRGVGKSVLLAQWLKLFQEDNPGIVIIYHFIGASSGDSDISIFLRRCVRTLRRHFLMKGVVNTGASEDNGSWWSSEDRKIPSNFDGLCQAFVAALGLGPSLLVLDGVNDLSATCGRTQQQVKEFEWLPAQLPPHCRIIMSTVRTDLTWRALTKRADVKVETLVPPRDRTQIMALLDQNLKAHVKPYVYQKQKLVSEMKVLTSPLAIRLVAVEINCHEVFTQLESFVDAHQKTTTLSSLWEYMLQCLINQHSWTRDTEESDFSENDDCFDYPGWVCDALCLIATSRGGMRQDEILHILKMMGYTGPLRVSVLHWLHLRQHLGGILWELADGRIRFSNQHLVDLTLYTLLRSVSSVAPNLDDPMIGNRPFKVRVHQTLAVYFRQQPLSWRQIQELFWHFTMMGDFEGLISYFTQNRIVEKLLCKEIQYPDVFLELKMMCEELMQKGHRIEQHYLSMLYTTGLITLSLNNMTDAADTVGAQQASFHNWKPAVSDLQIQGSLSVTNDLRKDNPSAGTITSVAAMTVQSRKSLRRDTYCNTSNKASDKSLQHGAGSPMSFSKKKSLASGLSKESRESHSNVSKTSIVGWTTWIAIEKSKKVNAEDNGLSLQVQREEEIQLSCSYRLPPELLREFKDEESIASRHPSTRGSREQQRSRLSSPQDRCMLNASKSPCMPRSAVQYRQSSAPYKTARSVREQSGLAVTVSVTRPQSAPLADCRTKVHTIRSFSPPSTIAHGPHNLTYLQTQDRLMLFPGVTDILEGIHDSKTKMEIVADLTWNVAGFLYELGYTEDSILVYSSLLSFLRASYPLPASIICLLVRLLEHLGGVAFSKGEVESAAEYWHQALSCAVDLQHLGNHEVVDQRQVATLKGTILGRYGYLYLQTGNLQEAGALLKEALKTISHLNGNQLLRASLHFYLGLYRGLIGDIQHAEISLHQCLALRQQWHGQVHAEVAEALLAVARVANIKYRIKRCEERNPVELMYRKALKVSEACLEPDSLQVADILLELGELLTEEEGRTPKIEAHRMLQRSLDICTTKLGADNHATKLLRASLRRIDFCLQLGSVEASASLAKPEQTQISLLPQRNISHSRPWASSTAFSSKIEKDSVIPVGSKNETPAESMLLASERLLNSRPYSSKRISRAASASSILYKPSQGMSVLTTARVAAAVQNVHAAESRKPWRNQQELLEMKWGSRGEGGISGQASGSVKVLTADLSQPQADAGSLRIPSGAAGEALTDLEDHLISPASSPLGRETDKKQVTMKPSPKAQDLFCRYSVNPGSNAPMIAPSAVRALSAGFHCASQRLWSGKSTASSHVSHCLVPGPHDSQPGIQLQYLSGPNSGIESLLGPPPAPRDNLHTEIHHRSAFYHVPGRYKTTIYRQPPRRHQKTEGVRILDAVLAAKASLVSQIPGLTTPAPSSAAPRNIRVNQHDVALLAAETGINRRGTVSSELLYSARGYQEPEVDKAMPYQSYGAKYSKPISVI